MFGLAMCLKLLFLAAFFSFFPSAENAKILGIVSIPTFSHQVVYRPLWKALSLRGHQLTVLTSHPMNDPSLTNLTEIDMTGAYQLFNLDKVYGKIGANPITSFNKLNHMLVDVINYQLEHPEVQNLIKNESEHFDLVMVEYFLPAMYGFSYRFKCPYIGILTLDALTSGHETFGNPSNPVLYPDFQLPFVPPLEFRERLFSAIYYVLVKIFEPVFVQQYHEGYVKTFGHDFPSMGEIAQNASMIFVNTNPILHYIRPFGPATVQIGGGLQMMPLKELPKDLETFLDDSDEGVVYFSLGNNVGSTLIDERLLKVFLDTFRELPYKVLVKLNKNVTDNVGNVKIVKWVPQQDVLRHPNVKLFITQGGLQSIEESIYSYIPIVCLPFFTDQIGNCRSLSTRGYGLALDRHSLDKKVFKNAIMEVINNSKYKKKIKEVVEISLDQPMTGLEKAVWWTEYVLRHKGAEHLRNPAADVPFYQYLLLDVIAFIISVILIFIFLFVKIVKFVLKCLSKLLAFKIKLD